MRKSVNEDTLLSITGISVADVDAASGAVKITMSVAQGRLTLAQTTGLTFTVGDGTSDAAMTFTGTVANVNAALARWITWATRTTAAPMRWHQRR